MPCGAAPSRQCVYQFHHQGLLKSAGANSGANRIIAPADHHVSLPLTIANHRPLKTVCLPVSPPGRVKKGRIGPLGGQPMRRSGPPCTRLVPHGTLGGVRVRSADRRVHRDAHRPAARGGARRHCAARGPPPPPPSPPPPPKSAPGAP